MRMKTIAPMLALAVCATTALAQSVTYDYDKGADFSRIKTYAWATGINVQDEFNHKRVVDAIDAQLAAKGLTKVWPDSNPDVLVAYGASFDRSLAMSGSSSDWGGPFFRTNRSGSARVDEIVTGTLVVAIADAKTNSLLWRGVAKHDLDQNAKPEQRDKKINKAAAKLLENFPPKR